MIVEYHSWHSPHLNRTMELKLYGHGGKPVVVFPTTGGRFYEYEESGMVEACRPHIDAGKLVLFTVDGVDTESWMNSGLPPAEKVLRHDAYERYIIIEVIPFIRSRGHEEPLMATGCSLGAYHAANIFFRHPDVFDAVVALSGVYQTSRFVGDHMDDLTYFHTPLSYLSNLTDPWYLERYRASKIVVCVGQGAWEEESVVDTIALKNVLDARSIPAWIDFWGYDVSHDWPWWRRQIEYFLATLLPLD